jgi:membrane protease subunit (stomatin/prohibitin family)
MAAQHRGGHVPDSTAPGFPTGFIVLFVIVAIVAVGGAIWRAVILSRGGLNPLVAKEQLEVQLAKNLQGSATAASSQPAKTIEERLAELNELHERGIITAAELAAGRAKVIGGD